MRVFVLLPAYNERTSIVDLIVSLRDTLRDLDLDYRILVVDDGSTDGTGDAVTLLSDAMHVTLLTNEVNLGLGRTVLRAIRWAVGEARPKDVIVTMDADLTHRPSHIPQMLAAHERGADVVIASRFRPGSTIVGVPAHRRVLSWGVRIMGRLLMPLDGVRDYACGYRMYDARVLAAALQHYGDDFLTERGFAYTLEVLLHLDGWARFEEIPFELRYDMKRKLSTIKIAPTICAYLGVVARESGPRRTARPSAVKRSASRT